MGTHNICLYKVVDKKYSGCDLNLHLHLLYVLLTTPFAKVDMFKIKWPVRFSSSGFRMKTGKSAKNKILFFKLELSFDGRKAKKRITFLTTRLVA